MITEINRHNSYTLRFAVGKDLSSVTGGFYTIAMSAGSDSALIQIKFSDAPFSVSDPAGGDVDIELTEAQTDALPVGIPLYEELHLIDAVGTQQTVYKGHLLVKETIAKEL